MAWKNEIKVEHWDEHTDHAVTCGVDSDGDIGLIDQDGYSIILSPHGAQQLANWINGLPIRSASPGKPSGYGDPCKCQRCMRERSDPNYRRFMHVCPICGNKRCPHCADHRFQCTGSNEPDQVGKPIPTVPQRSSE